MKYPYGLACYPNNWFQAKVSRTKICIQFQGVDMKLRSLSHDLNPLPKRVSDQQRYIPITTTEGDSVEILAVGCQMPVIEDLQMQLIDAYNHYARHYLEDYKKEYNKDFAIFLESAIIRLQETLNKIKR